MLVIGKGNTFYDVPDDVLAKYILSEDKAANLKLNVKVVVTKKNDVEGYGVTDTWIDEFLEAGTGQEWPAF